jgi:hypothetical protein
MPLARIRTDPLYLEEEFIQRSVIAHSDTYYALKVAIEEMATHDDLLSDLAQADLPAATGRRTARSGQPKGGEVVE